MEEEKKEESVKEHEGSSFGKQEAGKKKVKETEESNDLSREDEDEDIEQNQKTYMESLLSTKFQNRTLNQKDFQLIED